MGRQAEGGWLHSAWQCQPLPQHALLPLRQAGGWSLFCRGQLSTLRWGYPWLRGQIGDMALQPLPTERGTGPFLSFPQAKTLRSFGQGLHPQTPGAGTTFSNLGPPWPGGGYPWESGALAGVRTDPRRIARGQGPGSSLHAPPPTKQGISRRKAAKRGWGGSVDQAGVPWAL